MEQHISHHAASSAVHQQYSSGQDLSTAAAAKATGMRYIYHNTRTLRVLVARRALVQHIYVLCRARMRTWDRARGAPFGVLGAARPALQHIYVLVFGLYPMSAVQPLSLH